MSVTGHHYKATRVRGLAAWSPTASSRDTVDRVLEVLDDEPS